MCVCMYICCCENICSQSVDFENAFEFLNENLRVADIFSFCFFSTTRIFAFFQNNPPTVNVVCSCFCWGCFLLEEGGCIQS